MKKTIYAAVALAAAATLALPGTAGAAPAVACGTGAGQWVGVYEGSEHMDFPNYPDQDIPLDVTITNSTTGLKVTTVLHNGEQTRRQMDAAVVENGLFHWATLTIAGEFYALHDHYDTTNTSCDSAGTITGFNGALEGWVNAEHVVDGTFTLTRTT